MSLSALALTGDSRVPLVGAARLCTRHTPVITFIKEIIIIVGLVFLPTGLPHSGDCCRRDARSWVMRWILDLDISLLDIGDRTRK